MAWQLISILITFSEIWENQGKQATKYQEVSKKLRNLKWQRNVSELGSIVFKGHKLLRDITDIKIRKPMARGFSSIFPETRNWLYYSKWRETIWLHRKNPAYLCVTASEQKAAFVESSDLVMTQGLLIFVALQFFEILHFCTAFSQLLLMCLFTLLRINKPFHWILQPSFAVILQSFLGNHSSYLNFEITF